jgi:hypothetical protein
MAVVGVQSFAQQPSGDSTNFPKKNPIETFSKKSFFTHAPEYVMWPPTTIFSHIQE